MPYDHVIILAYSMSSESGGFTSVLKLIGLIILCALIIAASYFTTKFVGKKQLANKGKSNFRSIDVFRVTTNKYLQIVEIGERYFCISVTKDKISLICELDKEEIKHFPPEPVEKSFKECMTDIFKKKEKEKKSEFPKFNKEKE
jgi:flagellar protein FliO/FliZ